MPPHALEMYSIQKEIDTLQQKLDIHPSPKDIVFMRSRNLSVSPVAYTKKGDGSLPAYTVSSELPVPGSVRLQRTQGSFDLYGTEAAAAVARKMEEIMRENGPGRRCRSSSPHRDMLIRPGAHTRAHSEYEFESQDNFIDASTPALILERQKSLIDISTPVTTAPIATTTTITSLKKPATSSFSTTHAKNSNALLRGGGGGDKKQPPRAFLVPEIVVQTPEKRQKRSRKVSFDSAVVVVPIANLRDLCSARERIWWNKEEMQGMKDREDQEYEDRLINSDLLVAMKKASMVKPSLKKRLGRQLNSLTGAPFVRGKKAVISAKVGRAPLDNETDGGSFDKIR